MHARSVLGDPYRPDCSSERQGRISPSHSGVDGTIGYMASTRSTSGDPPAPPPWEIPARPPDPKNGCGHRWRCPGRARRSAMNPFGSGGTDMETPLTPLEFARRARALYSEPRGRRRRRSAPDLRPVLRSLRPLVARRCSGSACGRATASPTSRPNTHAQLESFYAVPADRRRARADQLPPDRRRLRLHHRPQRREGRLRPRRLPGGGRQHPRPDPERRAVRRARRRARRLARLRGRARRRRARRSSSPRSPRPTCSRSTTPAARPRAPRA